MFDSPDYPQALDETIFDKWMESGRDSKIPYAYLLIIWDELEGVYLPEFVESRKEIQAYSRYGQSPEYRLLVAAYDLFSEGRVV
jgi:hypothetical protein